MNKEEIRKILLKELTSNYDEGNIEDGGIGGGDECIDKIFSLMGQQSKAKDEEIEEAKAKAFRAGSAMFDLKKEIAELKEGIKKVAVRFSRGRDIHANRMQEKDVSPIKKNRASYLMNHCETIVLSLELLLNQNRD